jgi:hypothetical protein
MVLDRRHFLQFAGTTLATLGLSQWDVQRRGDRYARVLAQSTPRKLALLVGINTYPESSQYASLKGCVTDVELQRQLLMHRFGFQPADILTLMDQQATRQGILTAFETHLIQQAKAGDVVVFHYSGHGSQVVDPDRDTPDGLNSTFVPADSALPAGYPDQSGIVKDITGHTLFLLMRALPTENVTVVLDSCHSGGAKRDYVRVRSRAGGAKLQASPEEFAYQQQWLSRLNLSPDEYVRQRRSGVARGVVIASAKRDQLAADAPFSDFYAGAFTYLMTQYLWQHTGSAIVGNTIPNLARSTTKVSPSGQEPEFEVKPGSSHTQQPLYFTPAQRLPAAAVITRVQGNQAEVWLGGLEPQSLVAFGQEAVLSAIAPNGSLQAQVKLSSRTGLLAQGTLLNPTQPGALLQEQVRGIPTNVALHLGLASSLGDETTAAQQALQALKRIKPVLPQQGEVHYILGRSSSQQIGLFYPNLTIVPGSLGAVGESAVQAVSRLQAKLTALFAARLVRLTLNARSSRLNVQASLSTRSGVQSAEVFEVRGCQGCRGVTVPSPTWGSGTSQLAIGTQVALMVQNNDDRDLYLTVLVIDAAGEMTVIFPNQWTATAEVMRIAAGQTLQIPGALDNFSLVTQEPKGATEVLIIASVKPLGNALKALQGVAVRGNVTRGVVGVTDPIAVVNSLLTDLDGAARSAVAATDVHRVDTSQLAALAIGFEVV